jgi:ubiquinone/menaquinone biosynthesis C-methylase UbiE
MQAKAYKGMGMEGTIARWYAKTTRKDLGEFKALARRMAGGLPPDAQVLEVAPGPGYFAIELAKLGKHHVTGLDISKTFVEIARKNAQKEGVQVDFRQGNASQIPFGDKTFDLIVCRAAFKNFSEPVEALKEMKRVLKPGGKAVIIDLGKDTPKETIDSYIDRLDVNPFNKLFMKWTFRAMLLKRAYTKEDFERFIRESGFEASHIDSQPLGYEITLCRQA